MIGIDSYEGHTQVSLLALAGFITSSAFVWGWYDMTVGLYATLWRCPRRTAKRRRRRRARHLPIHFYTCPCSHVHTRGDARCIRACACTPTLHALFDGTDIRLRCQPIVKGTIRITRTDRPEVGPLPIFFSLSFSIFFFLMPFICDRMIDIYCQYLDMHDMIRCRTISDIFCWYILFTCEKIFYGMVVVKN